MRNYRRKVFSYPKAFPSVTFISILLLGIVLPVFLIGLYVSTNTRHHAAGGSFQTLPPGASLPTEQQCAALVRRNAWEPRPANTTANHTVALAQGHATGTFLPTYAAGYEERITGNFTGTTDEILQWGACKWGFDEDTVRAQAVKESNWDQGALGDCRYTTQPEAKGCGSVGILQVKGANIPPTHPGTWPYAFTSTAFNVDYVLAVRRACFDGKLNWLGNGYAAGDVWGCIGEWYSGQWNDSDAQAYIAEVKANYTNKPWIAWGYPGNNGGGNEAPITSVPTELTPPLHCIGSSSCLSITMPTPTIESTPCIGCVSPTMGLEPSHSPSELTPTALPKKQDQGTATPPTNLLALLLGFLVALLHFLSRLFN
jgi:autotransporter family porin